MQAQFGEINKRLTEGNLQLNDMENGNKKSMSENSELLRQLEEVDGNEEQLLANSYAYKDKTGLIFLITHVYLSPGNISTMNKMKIQLSNQLDDAKRLCDDETKERQSLLGRYRNLEHEFDGMNQVYEEELSAKEDQARMCLKAEEEANHWRLKVRKLI